MNGLAALCLGFGAALLVIAAVPLVPAWRSPARAGRVERHPGPLPRSLLSAVAGRPPAHRLAGGVDYPVVTGSAEHDRLHHGDPVRHPRPRLYDWQHDERMQLPIWAAETLHDIDQLPELEGPR